jgi:hypothetical protein
LQCSVQFYKLVTLDEVRFFAWPNSSEVLMNLLNSSVAHTLLGTVLLKLVKHTLCLEHLYSRTQINMQVLDKSEGGLRVPLF